MNGPLAGRTVLLGVTGSIAAYKAAELASALVKSGADVFAVMTASSREFIGPLTFESLTGRPVACDMFETGKDRKIEHIALARRADLMVIAPATANVIGKLAHGVADDLLTATAMASTAPLIIAPAMNAAMWASPALQENVAVLRRRGAVFVEPGHGFLACGEVGAGRLADTEIMMDVIREWALRAADWKGRRVLVTAGPTREMLDRVRFISNPSSGKMGYAVAQAARSRGAEVVLVTGPTSLVDPFGVKVVRVNTGSEMREAVKEHFEWCDVLVKSAAVTDYRSRTPFEGKKKDSVWEVDLEKIGNILDELSAIKGSRILVGFAAESGDPVAEGERKQKSRGLDLVVANDISSEGAGFGSDTNKAVLIRPDGRNENLPLLSKRVLADRILDEIQPLLQRIPAHGSPGNR